MSPVASLTSESPALPLFVAEDVAIGHARMWNDVLQRLRRMLNPVRNRIITAGAIQLEAVKGGAVILAVGDPAIQNLISTTYKPLLLDLWRKHLPALGSVEITVKHGLKPGTPVTAFKLTGKVAKAPLPKKALASGLPEEWARELLVKYKGRPVRQVKAIVGRFYHVPHAAMVGPKRDRGTTKARQVAMHLSHTLFGQTLKEIGDHFGRRDHTTVIYSLQKMERMLGEDKFLRAETEHLAALIRAGC